MNDKEVDDRKGDLCIAETVVQFRHPGNQLKEMPERFDLPL